MEDRGLWRIASRQIRQHHEHLSEAVQFEERIVLADLTGEPDSQAEAFFAKVIRTLDAEAERDPALRRRMAAWVRRFAARQHPEVWRDPVRVATFLRAFGAELKAQGIELPDGLDINRALWALDPPGRPRQYLLWQRGESFVIEAAENTPPTAGSLVATLRAAAPVVQVREDAGPGAAGGPWRSLPLDGARGAAVVSLPETGGIDLKTDHDTLCIEPIPRPDWATAMGRDREGLFAVVGEGKAERRVYWLNPGSYLLSNARGKPVASLTLESGLFLDQAEFEPLARGGFRQPAWAEAVGVDEYGLFVEFRVQGVT
jgi:hypothetical protein